MPFEDIFSSLAKDLFILRGTKEDVDAWRRRLIYSALGKLALASVWMRKMTCLLFSTFPHQ